MTPKLPQLKKDVRHLVLDLRQMKSFCRKPLIIDSANGIYVTDVDGKRYIDGVSGIYVVNIGHGNEYVLEAIRRQQRRVSFVAPLHAVSDMAVEYAKRLTEITPAGLDTVKLVSGGSEATETAIKFARQYHRQSGNPAKYKVIANHGGYHGATLGALAASGLGGPRKSVFGPFMTGFVHIPPAACLHCPYRLEYPSCDVHCAHMLEYTIREEGPESVAAYILEPISNTGGIRLPPPEYFGIIRGICTKYNVLLIYDEIITGMGRIGDWFAAEAYQVAPDLLCIGKGLASGYAPLAATVIRDELYYSAFWGEDSENVSFAHGYTFGANPVSAAAGLAVIEVIEKDDLIAQGRKVGEHIRHRLSKEVAELGILADVRGKGALSCVEFVEDMANMRPFPLERQFGKCVEKRLLDAGLILRCDPHWISFAPPFITTIQQADEMLDIFLRCVADEIEDESRHAAKLDKAST